MSGRKDQEANRTRGHRAARAHHPPAYDAGQATHPSVGEQMSLAELTAEADVSVRTVRYYIAEGLLPPPEGAGPASAYTTGHLARLRVIQRLKEAYLPLKEIRRRLAGLEDDEVLALLAHEDTVAATSAPPDATLAEARDYLALLETRARYRTEPMPLSMPPAPPAPAAAEDDRFSMKQQLSPPAPEPGPRLHRSMPGEDMMLPAEPSERDSGLWRRIPLGDDAELVISDRVYARHRDRIDWLVRWARKVFA
jgi:DNA-binding transcriptional MerR regulator